jgi:glycosyltransferase involved in cell wall biosynthesis
MNRSNLTKSTNVEILLATFNGEKFLARQIESVISQTHTNWRLLISDDGSTDSTLEIATRFSLQDQRIAVVNSSKQGGVVPNFSKALSFAAADYFMFCDQDDVWLDDKIAIMLDHLIKMEETHGKNVPILGFSDLSVVDHDLSEISESFYVANKLDPNNNLDSRYLMWSSSVYGCTVIFNAALARIAAPIPAGMPMHDQWFALVATLTGLVFYVPKRTIMYRQHSANVVGARRKNFYSRLISTGKNLRIIGRDAGLCRHQIREAYRANDNSGFAGRSAKVGRYDIDNVAGRIKFAAKCIWPFFKERTVYAFLFIVIFVLKKNAK